MTSERSSMKEMSKQDYRLIIEVAHLSYSLFYCFVSIPQALSLLVNSSVGHSLASYTSKLILIALLLGLVYDNIILGLTRHVLHWLYNLKSVDEIESSTHWINIHKPRYVMHITLLPLSIFCYARFVNGGMVVHILAILLAIVLAWIGVDHAFHSPIRPIHTLKYHVDRYVGTVTAKMIQKEQIPPELVTKHLLANALPPIITCFLGLVCSIYLCVTSGIRSDRVTLFAGCLSVFLVNGALPPSKKQVAAWNGVLMNLCEVLFMFGMVRVEAAISQ